MSPQGDAGAGQLILILTVLVAWRKDWGILGREAVLLHLPVVPLLAVGSGLF